MTRGRQLTASEAAEKLRRHIENPDDYVTPEEVNALQAAEGLYSGRLFEESPSYRDGVRALRARVHPGSSVKYVDFSGPTDEKISRMYSHLTEDSIARMFPPALDPGP